MKRINMNNPNDTPRTDAAEPQLHSNVGGWVLSDFARQLERELAASNSALDQMTADAVKLKADFERLKTLMHQTIWLVDDMIKTHANGCENCVKNHGAMIALFRDITEEPQWPINPTEK